MYEKEYVKKRVEKILKKKLENISTRINIIKIWNNLYKIKSFSYSLKSMKSRLLSLVICIIIRYVYCNYKWNGLKFLQKLTYNL